MKNERRSPKILVLGPKASMTENLLLSLGYQCEIGHDVIAARARMKALDYEIDLILSEVYHTGLPVTYIRWKADEKNIPFYFLVSEFDLKTPENLEALKEAGKYFLLDQPIGELASELTALIQSV